MKLCWDDNLCSWEFGVGLMGSVGRIPGDSSAWDAARGDWEHPWIPIFPGNPGSSRCPGIGCAGLGVLLTQQQQR